MVFESVRALFTRHTGSGEQGPSADAVKLAACALLLEAAHADEEFRDEERARIVRAAREMGVAESELKEFLRLAEEKRRDSVDLFQFTRVVTESFSREERLRLVEAIWGVVYSDGILTEAENRLARRIAEMLGFQHPEVQAAKERVAGKTG